MSWLVTTGTERRSLPAAWLERIAWLTPGVLVTLLVARSVPDIEPPHVVAALLLVFAGVVMYRWLRSTGIRSGLGLAFLAGCGIVSLRFNRADAESEAFGHLFRGILFLLPIPFLMRDFFEAAGLSTLRQARSAVARLLNRTEWPLSPSDCRHLPEVRQLREAILLDPTPALHLLRDPRLPVKVAALMALEFRPTWLPGQADQIAYMLTTADEPILRSGCLRALAPITDPALTQVLLNFPRDPSRDVRSAAIDSLLFRPEKRWHQIRQPLHDFLNDPRYAGDGAMAWSGALLPVAAVNDLMSWSAEIGTVSLRATLTLVAYYHRAINETGSPELVTNLVEQLRNDRLPAVFRIELAHLLKKYQCLDRKMLEAMLAPSEPSALRLLAAESLLSEPGQTVPHAQSVATLKEVARHPNREMAITTASIVQRCLRVDMGLPWGQGLPSLQSKQAAEVTRRVMAWASNDGATPPPSSMSSLSDEPFLPPPPEERRTEPPNTATSGWDW